MYKMYNKMYKMYNKMYKMYNKMYIKLIVNIII